MRRWLQRSCSKPRIVSSSVTLNSFMTALSRRRRARTGDQLGLVHFEVATDPWYIFKWPQLVHFEWPPREKTADCLLHRRTTLNRRTTSHALMLHSGEFSDVVVSQ